MNERIQKLAEQAGLIAGEHDDLDFKKKLTAQEQKFAELIVQECAELMPQDNLYKMVLKHFGVER